MGSLNKIRKEKLGGFVSEANISKLGENEREKAEIKEIKMRLKERVDPLKKKKNVIDNISVKLSHLKKFK